MTPEQFATKVREGLDRQRKLPPKEQLYWNNEMLNICLDCLRANGFEEGVRVYEGKEQ